MSMTAYVDEDRRGSQHEGGTVRVSLDGPGFRRSRGTSCRGAVVCVTASPLSSSGGRDEEVDESTRRAE